MYTLYRCQAGHVEAHDPDAVLMPAPPPPARTCWRDERPMIPVTDAATLWAIAETVDDPELCHIAADLAIHAEMQRHDPAVAARYRAVLERGAYYI